MDGGACEEVSAEAGRRELGSGARARPGMARHRRLQSPHTTFRSLNLKHVRPHRSQVDAVMVRQAHAKNIQVIAHFANEESDLRSLIELHVNGIVTGRLERLKTLLAETKK